MWVYGLDWADPGWRQVADAFECGIEPSGSVKCGEFLDQLQTSYFLKKDSAPWREKVNVLYQLPCTGLDSAQGTYKLRLLEFLEKQHIKGVEVL